MSPLDEEFVDSVVSQFYKDYCELVRKTMNRVRPDLRKELGPLLHDKSSVYGVEWP